MAGYLISDNVLRELRRIKRKVDSISGPGIVNASDSVTIHPVPALEAIPPLRRGGDTAKFLAKITGHADVTANAKWKYAWSEVRLDGDAVETFTGGRSGTTTVDYAINLLEIANTTAAAVGGDGVNPSGTDYPAGFKRRPIGGSGTADTHAVDVVVEMTIRTDKNGAVKYTFSATNAHDGTCAA